MNRRNIMKAGVGAIAAPLTVTTTLADPTHAELMAAMHPDCRQDYECFRRNSPLTNDSIKEHLLNLQSIGDYFPPDESEWYKWYNIDVSNRNNSSATKLVEKLLDSKEFDRILNSDWITVQPMSGPVGIAFSWSRDAEGNLQIEKTAVEATSIKHQPANPRKDIEERHIFDIIYSELEHRRSYLSGPNRRLIYCPYVILTNNGHHRFDIADNLHGNNGWPNS